MLIFQTRPFWLCMGVPIHKVRKRYQEFFGKDNIIIDKTDEALDVLLNVITVIQNEMIAKLRSVNSYDMLMRNPVNSGRESAAKPTGQSGAIQSPQKWF